MEKYGSEIIKLEIHSCGVSSFLEILNMVPNVKSLLLSDLFCLQKKPIRNFNELHLTKLQELEIDSCPSEFIEIFIDLPESVLVNLIIFCSTNLNFVEDIFEKQKRIKKLDLSCSVYKLNENLNLEHLNLTHLRYLNASGTTFELINILKSQPNLISLDLSLHISKYDLLKEISNLKHLKVLKLNLEKLSAQEFMTLKVDSLTELEIEYDHETNIDHITELSYTKNLKLTSLKLKFYEQDLNTEIMTRLAKNNPNLRLIEIENQKMNELIVCAFLKNCKNLETFRSTFSHNNSILNGTFNSSFNQSEMKNLNLKELKLFGIKLDMNIVLKQICVNYPNLEVIAFNCFLNIKDDDLKYFLLRCTKIKDLELTDCQGLTIFALPLISRYGKNIENVMLPSWFKSFAKDIFSRRLQPIVFNEVKYGG